MGTEKYIYYACYAEVQGVNNALLSLKLSGNVTMERAIEIDLNKNSTAASMGRIDWEDADVDVGRGLFSKTGFYSGWPEMDRNGWINIHRTLALRIYLSARFMSRNRVPLDRIGYHGHPYEVMCLLDPGRPGREDDRRYYGFHAKVTKTRHEAGRNEARVSIWKAGKSQLQTGATTTWCDISDERLFFQPREDNLGIQFLRPSMDSEGALFVAYPPVSSSSELWSSLVLPFGKKPEAAGGHGLDD